MAGFWLKVLSSTNERNLIIQDRVEVDINLMEDLSKDIQNTQKEMNCRNL
jgi:hypothetical protein